MSSSERNPAVELLEMAQEHKESGERGRKLHALNGVLQIAFDEAYISGDDSLAVEFAEETFAPEVQDFYEGKGNNEIDYTRWKKEFSDVEGERGAFHKPVSDFASYEYFKECMKVIEEEYDQIVGVHSGGLAPLYAVEDLFEAEPVVLRYSHRDRDDLNVHITAEMIERADFEGSDVLVIDDVVESGETFREVGQYLVDQEANSVDAVPVKTSIWDFSNDYELLDMKEGGVKYEIVDYEMRKDYTKEDASLVRLQLSDFFSLIYSAAFKPA